MAENLLSDSDVWGSPAQSVPPGLLSDDDLWGTPKPKEQRGAVAEIGRQIVGGLATRAPAMIGGALEWWAPQGSDLEDAGRVAKEYWTEKEKAWEPDLEGRGFVSSTLIKGASQLGPSLAGMGAAMINPVLGGAAVATIFGGQQAQDTYDKGLKAGLSEADASEAAYKTGLIEGFGETVADVAGAKLLTGGGKLLSGLIGKQGMSGAIRAATDPRMAAQFARDWAANAVIQSGTEFGQGYGQAVVERDAGISTGDPLEQGAEGAQSALGMSVLLGPLAAVGHRSSAKQRAMIGDALNDPNAPLPIRMAAGEYVAKDIEPTVGKEAAQSWLQSFHEAAVQDRDAQQQPIAAAPDVAPPSGPAGLLGYQAGPPPVVFPDGSTMTGAEAEQRRLDAMVQPVRATPSDILAAPDVDTAIAAAVDSVAASAEIAAALPAAELLESQVTPQPPIQTPAPAIPETAQPELTTAAPLAAVQPVQTPTPSEAQPEPAAAAPNVDSYLKQNAAGKWQLSRPVELSVKDAVIAEMDRRNQEGTANVTPPAEAVEIPSLQNLPQAAPEAGALPDQLSDAEVMRQLSEAEKAARMYGEDALVDSLNIQWENGQIKPREQLAILDAKLKEIDDATAAANAKDKQAQADINAKIASGEIKPPAPLTEREQFNVNPIPILQGMIQSGEIAGLLKAAKVKTIDAFESLPMSERMAAFDRLRSAQPPSTVESPAAQPAPANLSAIAGEISTPATPAQSITRTKAGKLEISGFSREDVAGSLKTAGIKATVAVGKDGRVLVTAVGRTGNAMPMPVKQQNAIKKALLGAEARPPKPRAYTGNLRNDVNLIAPGLYAEVARGGDGKAMGIDMSLVAESLRGEGFMLPTTGKDSDAVIELIRQDIANGGGTLNERRQTEAMDGESKKAARVEMLRLADEYGIETRVGITWRAADAVLSEIEAAITKEIGILGRDIAAITKDGVAAGAFTADEAKQLAVDIASGYRGDQKRDARVTVYREIAEKLQERINEYESAASRETGGRSGEGAGVAAEAEARPTFDLAGQTESEIRAEQERVAAAEAQRLKDEQAAENKRQADAERGSFNLTGSDRPADTMAAQGQGGLFDAQTAEPKTIAEASPADLLRAAADKMDGAAKPKKKADPLAAIREFFTPGNIILSDYWKTHDKVLEFREGQQGAGSWDVKVVQVKKDGDQWVETDTPRWHSTNPGKSKIVDHVAPQEVGAGETAPQGKETAASLPSEEGKEKIADFGEKIGGARKDVWSGYKDKLKGAESIDIKAEPLSKSWPAPDYQALIDAGADPWSVAFARAARDEVPRKPSASWKLKSWVANVTLLRGITSKLMGGEISTDRAQTLLAEASKTSRGLSDIAGRIELYMLVGHRQSLDGVSISVGQYGVHNGIHYDKPKTIWSVSKEAAASAWSNWPRELAIGDTRKEAMENFKAAYDKLDITPAATKAATFDIYVKFGEKTYFIGKKVGRNHVDLAGPFDTVKEARAHRTEHEADLVAKLEKFKEIPKLRRDVNQPRVGEDMRGGADVTQALFAETFGFKGVEFGNWVEQARRQKDLNDAFDALMDMAAVLGIPPKALSLNGELGLAFGARGTGGIDAAAAHYESDKIVINLTKKSGEGSLGHEFFHALDNYFSRLRGKGRDFTTEALDVSLAGRKSPYHSDGAIRKEMIEAFGTVMRAIRSTALKARSSKLDAKRSKEYWTTDREMAARAFESYLISKLHDNNASNDYLSNIVDEVTWKAAEKLGFELDESYPYPTAGEVPVIRAAFDEFFTVIQTKETDKGIALESRDTANIEIAARRMAKFVDAFLAGQVKDQDTQIIGPTPTVLQALGAEDLSMQIDGDTVRKILAGKHRHFMTADMLKQVSIAIYDPLMVFDSIGENEEAGKLVITELNDRNGNPVVAAIHLGKPVRGGRMLINDIASAYGMENSISRLMKMAGDLQYVRNESGLTPSTTSNLNTSLAGVVQAARDLGVIIKTEADVVNQYGNQYSKAPAATLTNETPVTIRAGLSRSLGKSAVDRLEQSGLLRILDTADSLPDGLTISDTGTALYDGKTAYIIADRTKPAEAIKAVLHEIGEHHGLEGMLGEKGYKTLTNRVRFMEKAGNRRVGEAFAFVRDAYPEYDEKTDPRFMKEVLANIGQDADVRAKPWWQEMIAAVRRWLVKLGYGGLIKTSDIEDLVLHSLKVAAGESQSEDSRGMVEAMASKVGADATAYKAVDTESPDMSVEGFSSFEAVPSDDGSVNFYGTAKVKGEKYFATIKVTRREDGSPKIGLTDSRFETMTGKNVRGAANVTLEDLMDTAKEAALAWASKSGAFDPTNPSILESRIIGDSGRQYTPDQQAMFKQTGREVDQVTILGKLREWASVNWRQGLFDQFQPVRAISDKGYTLLRLSKGATGAFEAFMQHGKLSLKDGAYDADTSGGVMQEVFFPLGKETTDFLYWIAGNRAERLAMEGKERLFSAQDIAAAKSLSAGTLDFDYVLSSGRTTRSRLLAYRDSLDKFNAFNKNVMDMAEQSGLIDGASRHLWEHEFYVPFYRLVDDTDGGVRGMNIKQGVVRQQAFKKLKGGKEGLNDLLANTLMNWAHLIDASAKNRGAMETLKAAARLGAAQPAQAGDKNTVWYMDGGKKAEYTIDDPELLVALNALDYSGLRGPIMDALQKPKHWLTIGVTASPFFKVRNLIRDSVQAVATSGLSYNVAGNIVNGINLTNRDRQEYVSALAGGGLIRFGTMLEGNEAARTRQLIKKGAKDEHILNNEGKIRAFYDKYLEPGISAYNEIGNRGEEINRMSLYDQMIKSGADHATASLMARDLLDFSMQGSWTSIRFLAQVVPFLNARLEGMYKLGRAAKSDPAKFGAVLGAVALFSLALLAAYSDDDDWKKREDWDRDNYWWFKVGGVAFRIPKPFEIGAIATLAERSAELMFSHEMTGKRFRQVTTKLLADQLSMNPTPQLVKPILDIYANKDSFSGRPIETMGMERLDKERRFTSSTSIPARGLSTATGGVLSPVQIDHLVRGYFAWLGAFAVGTADLVVRMASDGPDRPSRDYWKFATGGMIAETDSASSRYVSQMYDQAKEIETAYGTWRDMSKQASQMQGAARQDALKDAQAYRKANADKIAKHSQVGAVKRQISAMNERIRVIERSDKTADEKRALINNIQKLKDQAARRVVATRRD